MSWRNNEKFDGPKFGPPRKTQPEDHRGPGQAREDHRSDASADRSARGGTIAASSSGSAGISARYLEEYIKRALAQSPAFPFALPQSSVVGATLPTEHTPEAVQAWKIARLYTPDGWTVKLGAVHRDAVHPVEGEAVCVSGVFSFGYAIDGPHTAPGVSCQCGFYAWKTAAFAREYMKGIPDGFVLMQVELFGTVIQYERGYRAQRQRVLGVAIPSTCSASLCGKPAVVVDFPSIGRDTKYRVLCAEHKPEYSLTCVGIADVANALGCEVTWEKS